MLQSAEDLPQLESLESKVASTVPLDPHQRAQIVQYQQEEKKKQK